MLRTGLFVCLFALPCAVHGAEPAPADPLPAPRPLIQEGIEMPMEFVMPPGFLRTNRYDVWQNYSVDRTGHFRPRVIYTPHQPYYYVNGKPYLYLDVNPRAFMSYVAD